MYSLLCKKNIVKIFIPVLFIVGLSLALFASPSNTAMADINTNQVTNGAASSANNSNNKDSDITCAIEKMGWILCPIIETSGKVGDQVFNFLSKTFLQTEPELISNSPSGTKAAWEIARNLANIMFIIAFLIIILSQVTGQGLNNYGVKKMLPRLVIAAIAVNVSYYICQLIVDLTNILGFEIQRFMVNQAAAVSDKAALPVQTGLIDTKTAHGGALGKIASGALGLPTIIWFLLPMLFLGIGTVVITCIVIVIILLLRKAFIVLLVVASPIAFVAYILPNTEKYFQKWGRMFWQLLLVFPIVSLLFGGGQLASAIVLVAGSSSDTYKDAQSVNGGKCIQLPRSTTIDNNGNTTASSGGGWFGSTQSNTGSTAEVKTCAQGSTPFLLGLVAAGIAVAPMIAVWSVLKGSLSAAGAIGGKISGAVQNAGNKAGKYASIPEDKLKKRIGENANAAWMRSQARGMAGEGGRFARFAGRRGLNSAIREERINASKNELARVKRAEIDDLLTSRANSEILGGLTESGRARAVQGAQAAQEKLLQDQVGAAGLRARNMEDADLTATIDRFEAGEIDVNDPELAAAIDELGKRQNFQQLERVMNRVIGQGPSLASRTTAQTLSQNAGELFTGGQIANLSRGAAMGNYMDTVAANLAGGALTPEKMASIGPALAGEVSHIIASAAGSNNAVTALNSGIAANQISRAAGAVLGDDILNKKISRIEGSLNSFQSSTHIANR